MSGPPKKCVRCRRRPRRARGRECVRCHNRAYRRTEVGARRHAEHEHRYGRRAGKHRGIWSFLTREEWEALWRLQGGGCAICLTPLRNRYDEATEGQQAYTEHDHALEKKVGTRDSIRGLACLWCNRHILVALHDSAEKAQRAADYLRNPPARRVLFAGN